MPIVDVPPTNPGRLHVSLYDSRWVIIMPYKEHFNWV
jgi:hypothetical protein